MYNGYGMDWSYILVLIGIVITMVAQSKLKSTYSRYIRVSGSQGLTGADVARRILLANGITEVSVQPVSGSLTDHYNPANKTVNLSQGIYGGTSLAALGVAAHECGHAIQDASGYVPLRFRSAFAPVANIGSRLAWPAIIIGVLMSSWGNSYGGSSGSGLQLVQIGILLFALAVLFQLVTLPVEYNASERAMGQLQALGMVDGTEMSGVKAVLNAAALTYVAAAASSLLQLLRLMTIFGGRRNR